MEVAVITIIVLASLLLLVVFDDLRVRRIHTQLKMALAEAAATALGNSVLVDGIELPKPDDERWRLAKATIRDVLTGATHIESLLMIGEVQVSLKGLFVGDNARGMSLTSSAENYCAAVWRAYRSRVARKAIDSTQ